MFEKGAHLGAVCAVAVDNTILGPFTVLMRETYTIKRSIHKILKEQLLLAISDDHRIEIFLLVCP